MGIFISYRRSDSAPWAGRIYDTLIETWGEDQVYMDIDTIAPGDDFRSAITETLNRSDVVLVIIGPAWLNTTDETGKRRLDDRADVHRSEIVSSLTRDVRVIPVLVGGATMPEASDLPAAMRPLAYRNAVEIDDRHFHSHLESLREALARFADELADQRAREAERAAASEPEDPEALGAVVQPSPELHGTERARPAARPTPEEEIPSAVPSPPRTGDRHRWPARVLLLSIAIGALVGLLAAVVLVLVRDDDNGEDAQAVGTTVPSPVTSAAPPATAAGSTPSPTGAAAVDGESFVIFETDRGDPAPDPAERRHSIWRVDDDGSDARSLIASSGSDGHAALSSDGSRIAYLHTDTPADVESWELVVSNLDGSNPTVLVERVRRTYRPTWAPDDTAIMIPLSVDGQVDLWRIDVASRQRQQITDTPEPEYDPDWSTAGLVFRRDVDGDNAEIFRSDADGSDARRITDHPGYDSDPRWSPDDSLILFTRSFGAGNLEVCVMATDGTDVVNLTSTAGNDQDATWLPIGGGVVFVSDRDGPNQIYRMEGDGGGQRRLMESTSQDGVPDGR
jgi:hypothetical protein